MPSDDTRADGSLPAPPRPVLIQAPLLLLDCETHHRGLQDDGGEVWVEANVELRESSITCYGMLDRTVLAAMTIDASTRLGEGAGTGGQARAMLTLLSEPRSCMRKRCCGTVNAGRPPSWRRRAPV